MKRNEIFKDVLNTTTKLFVFVVIIIVALFCLSGIRFIKSGNVALVLRFGKLVGSTAEEQIHDAGILLAFPSIIDEVITVPTSSVIEQKIQTHYTSGKMGSDLSKNKYVITGDNNIAVISASLKYTVTDPVAYALKIKSIESIIDATVSNAMVKTSANMSVDDILTSGKEQFAKQVVKSAQSELDKIEVGVTIKTIELTYVGMPKEVRELYEGVNAATVEANTLIEKAEQHKQTVIPSAEASASREITAAQSEYSNAVANANSALSEFWGVLDEYKQNKSVVRTRIYNKKVAAAIAKIGTVKIVTDGNSSIIID